jgi:hypothetical protein
VRGDQRPAAIDGCPPIGLKRIRCIVQFDLKQRLNHVVEDAVQEQFEISDNR